MKWNETPHVRQLEILDQMQDGTKSPLQILLDAGITPSDGWVKELTFANDLLSNIKAKLPSPKLTEINITSSEDRDRSNLVAIT
jgi:hypothetical protein